MDELNPTERGACLAMAALLRAGQALAWLGLLLTAVAALGLLATPFLPFAVVLLLALPERYAALRVALDAQLFAAWGDGRIASLAGMDAALAALGRAPAPRPLAERLRGARRWLAWHAACVAGQLLALLVSRIWPWLC